MMTETDINMVQLLAIAKAAGDAVMDVYHKSFTPEMKDDGSPITEADRASYRIISRSLMGAYPDIPILSEEGEDIPYKVRSGWKRFWLIDPLDGTKEFIGRNDQFTVNIALIENSEPALGVIYIPAEETFYYACSGQGSYKIKGSSSLGVEAAIGLIMRLSERLPTKAGIRPFTIVTSRSHMSKETEEYIGRLRSEHRQIDSIIAGSSLKLCMVAEGRADAYPRFAPTMEWDIAAGQIIVEEAGGEVVSVHDGQRLRFNKESLVNPWFIATLRQGAWPQKKGASDNSMRNSCTETAG